MFDLSHTFVTSDHHFRAWKNCPLHGGCTQEDEMRQIALWNSVVGKDDLVLYIGDFYDSVPECCDGAVADLMDFVGKLNALGADITVVSSPEDGGAERIIAVS